MTLKILLWELPAFTRQILKKFFSEEGCWQTKDEEDLEVEESELLAQRLNTAIEQFDPDVLITRDGSCGNDELWIEFLSRGLRRKVFEISRDERTARLYRLRAERVEITDLSQEILINNIKEWATIDWPRG